PEKEPEEIREAEKEAEEALEDLPDIKKVDGIDLPDETEGKYKIPASVKKAVKQINENAQEAKAEQEGTGNTDDSGTGTAKPDEKPADNTDSPKKKSIFPVVLAALVVVGIIIGVVLSLDNSQPESVSVPIETTSVPVETVVTTAETTVTTAEPVQTTQTTRATVLHTAVSDLSESDTSETSETAPVLMRTTIEPAAHEQVMGTAVSCTVRLSEALITPDMLSDTSTFTAEYTGSSGAPMAPVGLVVKIHGDEISVPAFSYDDTTVVFRCDAVRAYVEESGHSFDEINELSFTGAGMPVDVSKVIIE
ncbi:MAG: hypothetical protein ILP19_04860, partial [Oscillospiraceae bacterium]|nr:hypothetical protein [Oscillospiraceae bacterium]